MGGFSIPSLSPSSSSSSSSGSNSNTGLGQGIDVNGTVTALLNAERGPEQIWQTQQKTMATQQTDLVQLNGEISALQKAFQALSDPQGALAAMSLNSSDASIVSGTADTGTAAGNHIVVVQNLATTSSYYTNPVASGTTLSGAFTIQVGSGTPQTISIDSSDNTLSGLASAINAQNIGVTASVVNDANGSRLALVSNSSGAPGAIAISANSTSLTFNQANAGANASLTVDGVPISSASNTVSGVIPGVTLNLNSAAPGTSVSVQIAANSQDVQTAVQNFVSAYNAVISQVNTEFTYNSATQTAGTLFGDSGLGLIQQQLLGDISSSSTGNGAIQTLADLGVTMNNDGTLSLNSSTLNSALASNYSSVQNFFQSITTAGFAKQFNNDLQSMTDPTQGALYQEITGLQSSQQDLQSQINNFEANLTTQQQTLLAEYSRVNVLLQQMPLLESQTQQQLASI